MCMNSMPASTQRAPRNDLKLSIGLVTCLMARWSCSTMLLRYLTWRATHIPADVDRLAARPRRACLRRSGATRWQGAALDWLGASHAASELEIRRLQFAAVFLLEGGRYRGVLTPEVRPDRRKRRIRITKWPWTWDCSRRHRLPARHIFSTRPELPVIRGSLSSNWLLSASDWRAHISICLCRLNPFRLSSEYSARKGIQLIRLSFIVGVFILNEMAPVDGFFCCKAD